jgi:hypothetical protein
MKLVHHSGKSARRRLSQASPGFRVFLRPRAWMGPLAIAALLAVALAGPALAQSVGPLPMPGNPFEDPIEAPRPVVAGSGVDDLLGLKGPADGTWLGTYGTGPYSLDSHLGVVDLEHQVQGTWASYLWSLVVWIARVLVALLSWAFTVDLFRPLAGVIDGVVGALVDSLWRPLAIPIIVLAGLWGAYKGIVQQKVSTMAEGWIWMLAAVAAGLFFFTQPTQIATGVNTFAAKLSNTALGAIAAIDPGLCAEEGQGKCVGGSAHLQEVTDRLWYLYVIKPYVVMEFGDGQREEPYLRRLLDAKTITRDDLAKVEQGGATPESLIQAKAEQYKALVADLKNDGDAFEWFSGRRNYERGMVAGMALVAVVIGAAVLGVVAAGVLLAQLGLLIAFLLAPVFLLLGIYPGRGRLIARRWGELSLGMIIRRVGLAILLAILLVTSGSIMTAADSAGGWYAAVILHVLLGVAALIYRKAFLGLLTVATPTPPLPRPEPVLPRTRKVANALGLGFAYAIGRQELQQRARAYVLQQLKPPPAPGEGGGPAPGGGGGGPAPGGDGPRGPTPANGGRALPAGPNGPAEGGNDGRSGPGDGPKAPLPTPALGSAAAGAIVAGALATGAVPGSARATAGRGVSGNGSRGLGSPTWEARQQTPQGGRAVRGDLHIPYRRDEQQRIIEPERRRRRSTPAERMQAERMADAMERAREQRRQVREQWRERE